jgi:hypothetical protein
MATGLRTTGIHAAGHRPWGTHFCHFYETTDDLLATLVPYFKAGPQSKRTRRLFEYRVDHVSLINDEYRLATDGRMLAPEGRPMLEKDEPGAARHSRCGLAFEPTEPPRRVALIGLADKSQK